MINKELKYGILGLGISGLASFEYLLRQDIKDIHIFESKTLEELNTQTQELIAKNKNKIKTFFALNITEEILKKIDILIFSPGLKPNHPILTMARENNIEIICEVDFAYRQIDAPQKNLIAVTGTNGKSTITSWIAHSLGIKPTGNIGYPLIQNLYEHPETDIYTTELSSFQLEHFRELHPHISIICNLGSDHIEWHESLENYHQSKHKITKNQTANEWLILPMENQNIKTQAKTVYVSKAKSENNINQVYLQDTNIVMSLDNENILLGSVTDINIAGEHNIINAMFTLAAIYINSPEEYDAQYKNFRTFKGLEHRIEYLGNIQDKEIYNDSKATNPESTITAIKTFDKSKTTLLLGGKDKHTNLDELISECKGIPNIILYGEASERFFREFSGKYAGNLSRVENLQTAFNTALKKSAETILLSPACSSFDQFENFERRGEYFKELYQSELKSINSTSSS